MVMDTKKDEEGAQWSGSELRRGERSSVVIGKVEVREIKILKKIIKKSLKFSKNR